LQEGGILCGLEVAEEEVAVGGGVGADDDLDVLRVADGGRGVGRLAKGLGTVREDGWG
jgi:hypothetical protein